MPERQAFIDQIKSVEREFYVVNAALNFFKGAVESRVADLPAKSSPRDLTTAANQVEATYLIRMWAAFEMALRSYRSARQSGDRIKAIDLVNWTAGVKQGRAISSELRDRVHEVRDYRNSLVHGDPAAAVSIEEARRRLNTLLQCLPIQW